MTAEITHRAAIASDTARILNSLVTINSPRVKPDKNSPVCDPTFVLRSLPIRVALVALAETAEQAERWQHCRFAHSFGEMRLKQVQGHGRQSFMSNYLQANHGHWPTFERAMRAARVSFRTDLPLFAAAGVPNPPPQIVPGAQPVFC